MRNADRIAVLQDGALLECGTHQELLALDGVYASLVARQLEKSKEMLAEGHDVTRRRPNRSSHPEASPESDFLSLVGGRRRGADGV